MSDMDQFCSLLRDAQKLRASIIASRQIINDESDKVLKSEDEFYVIRKQLIKLAEQMDVVNKGNYGWEPRFIQFLLGIKT